MCCELWALAVNSAVVKTTDWPILMLARPFDQLDQDHVTGPAETNPLLHILCLPLASPPSFWLDYQLKFHSVILILVEAQRRREESLWWKCMKQAADDGRINLSSLFMVSVTVWQRLLCRSLSLSFMNQVTCRLQEIFVCHSETVDRHSVWIQTGVFFCNRQREWLQVWKSPINSAYIFNL